MVHLLLAIHNHQPVGNFDNIFQMAYDKSYRPFIDVLEQHPQIRLSLHYTGSLLDWLEKHQPDFIARVRKLVQDGRVEIFAGGYYEPILTLIPERDAIEQGIWLKEKIEELFSYEAKGSWIAERVWEPKMPGILGKAGFEYGIVDDSHFGLVGYKPETLNGFYETEEDGDRFSLFPCCEQLRYDIPFGQPEKVIEYIDKRHKDNQQLTLTYGDDGEKFGLWPETYEWVYNKGWLNRFFSALEANSSWIKTLTFKEYKSAHFPTSRVYLPCASYREMLEWSGGFYRNFMVKYPEINLMHKRMLYVSQKLDVIDKPEEEKVQDAQKYLFMGQANDAYWHGVFGGLYLNHLRSAVYQNLIKAESLTDRLFNRPPNKRIEPVDIDCDGTDEIILRTEKCQFYFKPNLGGSLLGWDDKEKVWNLINTVSRREELYHKKIRENNSTQAQTAEGVKSIHDRVVEKEPGLSKFLFYDKNQRYCLFDHFLPGDLDVSDFVTSRYEEGGTFTNAIYEVVVNKRSGKYELDLTASGLIHGQQANLHKRIGAFDKGLTIRYEIQNLSDQPMETTLGVEFNFSVYDPALVQGGQAVKQRKFQIKDSWLGFNIAFDFDKETNVIYYPVETVSESETGFEKTFQELCCILLWPVKVGRKQDWSVDFKVAI